MSDAYVHQSYPKCVYVKDKTGKVCSEIVHSPNEIGALDNWAESPAGPFNTVEKVSKGTMKTATRNRQRLDKLAGTKPRKTKRSKS
jgi:hypothetical protein